MLNQFFNNQLTGEEVLATDIKGFLLCMMVSLVLGILIAALYTYKTKYTKSFVLTLAVLPAVVCVVIMMVNGNIGTGVAVAGTFSLVRFRSVPGTAKEIGAIFLAMGTGLATGMGYLGYAVLFVVVLSLANFLLHMTSFGERKATERSLTITIPEDLDYTGVFDDLFAKYTNSCELAKVKTTNMGSLFKVTYDIELKQEHIEKELIDELRCRNGNLEILMSKQMNMGSEL
ncbi:DUF4956 domain-containing protein [Chakrabartyella piscis]|uniref:DUF4956 domain-containing protein n=1 Tax=Chakrabartyella piscis TaxID=2918914 RepID=UPI003A7F166D